MAVIRIILLLVSCAACGCAGPAPGGFFVDPQGRVGGDGTRARPFRTIEAGRDAVRRLLSEGPLPSGGVTVYLCGGDYLTTAPIVFDDRDCGRPGSPVIYRAVEGEIPRLIGGFEIEPVAFEPVDDETVLSRLPSDTARESVRQLDLVEVAGESIRGQLCGPVHRGMGAPVVPIASEVFLDGRPLVRSRWPNLDAAGGAFARITAVVDPGSIPRNRESDIPPERQELDEPRGGTFRFDNARIERWATAEDAWASGYWHHDWADEQLPIEHVYDATRQIKLGLPHRYGLREGALFYITNLLEELDSPGEYYIDRKRAVLYLWPPAGSEEQRLTVSTCGDPLIQLKDAHHIQFIGLTIECTRGAAIRAENVRDLLIAGCTIQNTGTDGLVLSGTHNTIRSNDLTDIGAAGISVTGGDRKTLTPARNNVFNNHIRAFGRVYRTYAPAIRIGGVGQRVANNRLHDAPHSAIIFSGNDHLFERNEIFDVLKETGDCGAIYCGRDWTLHGTVIRHNLFHDLGGSDDRWQNAVYLDDMASGIHVLGNVFFECNWGMLVGGGRDILVRGNVFIGGSQAIQFDARGVGWMAPHLADPQRSTLHQKLAAVPYTKPPWSTRFPQLQQYLTAGFGRPVGSEVTGNAVFATKLGSITDREVVAVENNPVFPETPDFIRKEHGRVHFSVGNLTIDEIDRFDPIPVGWIGLLADEYRENEKR